MWQINRYSMCMIAQHSSVVECHIVWCALTTLKQSVVVYWSMQLDARVQAHVFALAYVCVAAVVFFVCTIILIVVLSQ